MINTVEEVKNRIAKGDVYYHTDARGFFRLIERGKKYSLCASLSVFVSDSVCTTGRCLVLNSHIDKFAITIKTMDELLKVADKKDSDDRVSFCIRGRDDDLFWYWTKRSDHKKKEFVESIETNTNSLPEEMKLEGRPDIAKRLENI